MTTSDQINQSPKSSLNLLKISSDLIHEVSNVLCLSLTAFLIFLHGLNPISSNLDHYLFDPMIQSDPKSTGLLGSINSFGLHCLDQLIGLDRDDLISSSSLVDQRSYLICMNSNGDRTLLDWNDNDGDNQLDKFDRFLGYLVRSFKSLDEFSTNPNDLSFRSELEDFQGFGKF